MGCVTCEALPPAQPPALPGLRCARCHKWFGFCLAHLDEELAAAAAEWPSAASPDGVWRCAPCRADDNPVPKR